MLTLIKNKKNIKDKIQKLKHSISSSKVFSPKDVSKFIFLCGANKDKENISERRRALMQFSEKHLPHTQFFLAEKMFSTLQKEGHKGNLLDIEHEISQFADHIILVLESPSSFAELGAFSHNELRDKLIVINNSVFKHSESFINLGPLRAIEESSGANNIIYYKMNDDGVYRLDSIGDVYSSLYDLLKDPIKGRSSALTLDDCNPASKFDKHSAMFIHDLIYFTGPINHKELAEITRQLFGDHNFKLKEHIAILGAFGSVHRDDSGFYRSLRGRSYYIYKFDINKLISTFRNYLLKLHPERIYGY